MSSTIKIVFKTNKTLIGVSNTIFDNITDLITLSHIGVDIDDVLYDTISEAKEKIKNSKKITIFLDYNKNSKDSLDFHIKINFTNNMVYLCFDDWALERKLSSVLAIIDIFCKVIKPKTIYYGVDILSPADFKERTPNAIFYYDPKAKENKIYKYKIGKVNKLEE